ncbi:MAG: phenylacetate--CoA ligase family protein [bacterium]
MSAAIRRLVLRVHRLTGRRVLERLEELNRTQWLGRESLLRLQRARLQQVVAYAHRHVPYYRRVFEEAGFRPDDAPIDPEAWLRIPVLTKAIVRARFHDLMTTEPERRRELTEVRTSGSTGYPLVFMQDRGYRDSVTADIQRHLGWAGWRLGEPHAYIWGASFDASLQHSLRARLLDWTWNRCVTNAYLMTEDSMAALAGHVRRRRPRILFGYASSLQRFARFVRRQALQDISFDGVFSSAEVLFPDVRRLIEETFRCRVFDRYGSKDLGGIACECEAHAGVHVSAENNYVEILRDGRPCRPGEVGEIVVTNLNNLGMPFIRYGIGDYGAWKSAGECPCGRAAPMLEAVQGRIGDSFKTRDGRTVGSVFAGLLADPGIEQFQIVQKSLDLVVVRLVKRGEISPRTLDRIARALRTSLGEGVRVVYEYPEAIPVLPSGKHRAMFSDCE